MKKFKFVALVVTVMVVTLLSVTGVWAGSMQQDTESPANAAGTEGTAITGDDLVDLVAEYPAPTGLTIYGAASQAAAGQVCFTRTWEQILAGDVQNPAIAMLNNGNWVTTGITTALSGLAPDGSGLQYCASVSAGTFAFLGY